MTPEPPRTGGAGGCASLTKVPRYSYYRPERAVEAPQRMLAARRRESPPNLPPTDGRAVTISVIT